MTNSEIKFDEVASDEIKSLVTGKNYTTMENSLVIWDNASMYILTHAV